MPQRCASAGVSVFTLPTTMGDLFRCTVLIGRRVTPSGRSAVRVNMRRRSCSTSNKASSRGSCARSQAMISFLFVGWLASGHITAKQPRSAGNMPDTCRKGRAVCAVAGRRSSAATRSFLCRPKAKVEQTGVVLAQQPRQRDGGSHVRQRIVRGLMLQAVGLRQVFQLEALRAVFFGRPHNAIGPQRIGQPHHVEQDPSGHIGSATHAHRGR
jgi:hypothetical protein